MEETPILILPEAAQLLRVSQAAVRRLIRDEGLPHVQYRKWSPYYFDRETILKWWHNRQTPKPGDVRAREIKLLRRRKHE